MPLPFRRTLSFAPWLLAAALIAASAPALAADANPARDHVRQWRSAWFTQHGMADRFAELTPELVGGGIAPPGSFPAVVALLFKGVPSNAEAQYCAGTLIAARKVLTAARCADFLVAADLAVLVGTQDLTSGGQRLAVSTIAVHPRWNPDTAGNDVAVLTLASAATGITPVSIIASTAVEAILAPEGTVATAVSWGETGAGQSTKLKQGTMPLLAPGCGGSPAILCAGAPDHSVGTCSGDSGGPLFVPARQPGRRLQAAVTSFGISACASPGVPDFFARLAVLGAWVKLQLRP